MRALHIIDCSDLGKVGPHTSGALISYVGKEHLVCVPVFALFYFSFLTNFVRCQIEKYEVLVCASQLRWGLASQDATGSLVPGTVVLARQQQGKHEVKRTASSLWSRETRESTSVFQTTLHVDDIPRFIPSLLIQEEELRRVACVFTCFINQILTMLVIVSTRLLS
jgi:hypothetical protein